jgi:hypothetical protein
LPAILTQPRTFGVFLGGPRLTANLTASDALETMAVAGSPVEDRGLYGTRRGGGAAYAGRLASSSSSFA